MSREGGPRLAVVPANAPGDMPAGSKTTCAEPEVSLSIFANRADQTVCESSPPGIGGKSVSIESADAAAFATKPEVAFLIFENKYLDKIKSILFSAIVRSSISDLSGLSRLAVG